MPIATNAQMKEIDAYAIRQLGVPSLQLMERAATAVTAQALALPAPGAPAAPSCCVAPATTAATASPPPGCWPPPGWM